jgi:hypothetical protein
VRVGIPTNAWHAHTKHAKQTPRAPCVRASGLPDQSGPVLTLEGRRLSPAAASAGVAHLTPPSSESANADRSACTKTSEIVIILEKLQAPHREARAKGERRGQASGAKQRTPAPERRKEAARPQVGSSAPTKATVAAAVDGIAPARVPCLRRRRPEAEERRGEQNRAEQSREVDRVSKRRGGIST